MAKTVSDLTHTGQVNSFTGGLNTDLHPLVQPNDTLTDCINGTLITFNGNENMLQNDMGNYALEGSALPDGFIPLGMKEYNGVVYIISKNPITEEVQVGSYPSPADDEIPVIESDITTQQINMSVPTITDNYTYNTLVGGLCFESQKTFPPITKFGFTVSLGDTYSITSGDDNIDFQHEQFCVEMDDGTVRNINITTDGELHKFDQKFTGQLCKKYELNKVTKFVQEVDYSIFESTKTRIVGGDENNATASKLMWQYPDPDVNCITVKNKLTFDRIDYDKVNNDAVYVGVLYEVVSGDPRRAFYEKDGKIVDNNKASIYSYYTHKLIPYEEGKLTYDFEYTISQENNDVKSFWFPKVWQYIQNDNNVVVRAADNSPINPIQVNTYPLLIHRVLNRDRSVLCYDNSKQSTEFSILDVKGSRTYQYYYANNKIYLDLDAWIKPTDDKIHNNTLDILDLHPDGSISENSTLQFTWSNALQMWYSDTFTPDSDLVFIRYDYLGAWYTMPLFLTVTEDKYNNWKTLYKDFCLISGNLLLYGGDEITCNFAEESTRKYVKVSGNRLYNLNNDFPESIVYDKENSAASYGDLECSTLTINNVQDGPIKVELQMQVDGNWKTIRTYETESVNNTAIVEDAPKAAYIAKCTQGDKMKYIERVYLAKHGHAPFAFRKDKTTWLKLLKEYAADDLKPHLQDLIKYGDWEHKKSVVLGKECGKRDPAFRMFYYDIFGQIVEDECYIGTEVEWLERINKLNQLFTCIQLKNDCETANFQDSHLLATYDTDIWRVSAERPWAFGGYRPYIISLTEEYPTLINTIESHSRIESSLHFLEKWLLYLYTHAFYYNIKTVSDTIFIKPKDKNKIRLVVHSDIIPSYHIKGVAYKLPEFIVDLKVKCNNFKYSNRSSYEVQTKDSDVSILWTNINNCVDLIKSDNNIISEYYNNSKEPVIFCDVEDNGKWSIVPWDTGTSNDINFTRAQNVWKWQFVSDQLLFKPDTKRVYLHSYGKKSGKLKLINLNGADYIGSMKYDEPLTCRLNDVESYSISPRFKQILTYETDN